MKIIDFRKKTNDLLQIQYSKSDILWWEFGHIFDVPLSLLSLLSPLSWSNIIYLYHKYMVVVVSSMHLFQLFLHQKLNTILSFWPRWYLPHKSYLFTKLILHIYVSFWSSKNSQTLKRTWNPNWASPCQKQIHELNTFMCSLESLPPYMTQEWCTLLVKKVRTTCLGGVFTPWAWMWLVLSLLFP